ncbi:hypothetical protein [Nostoc sp.]
MDDLFVGSPLVDSENELILRLDQLNSDRYLSKAYISCVSNSSS